MPSWPRGLWMDLPKAERRELKDFLRTLEARCGPFRDRVTRGYAKLTTEAWWTAQQASTTAVAEGVKRLHGRGRRPSLQHFDRRLKRQWLGVEGFDKLVRRLEELGGERKPLSLAELLSQRKAGA